LVIWLIIATGVAVGLYHVNYEVKALERALESTRQGIEEERERLHVLEAEWSYLNRPARLARLAEKHLDMETIDPDQIVHIEQLPPRITDPGETPVTPEERPDDAVPLPQAKPWSLTPRLSSATPFATEASP
jgi:cell division protein FtsL